MPNTDQPKRVRYAVFGLGWVAQAAVLPSFVNAAENSELVALVSGNREKLEQIGAHYGVKELYTYDQYEELLKSGKIDAVYLATPNDQHEEYTLKAAQHGVHVLCEKPMAVEESSCNKMKEECADQNVRFMVAYRLHFHPAFLRAIELARSGELGEVRLFDSHFVEPIPEGDGRLKRQNGCGPLDYIGIYCINAARALFGAEPESGIAYGTNDGTKKFSEVPEMVSVMLKFPHGRVGTFTCGFNSPYRSNFRLTGTKGDVFVDRAYAMKGAMTLTLTKDGKSEAKIYEANDQFGAELYYFSDCVLKKRDPQPSALEGLADVRWLRALHESLESGKTVTVGATTPEKRPDPEQAINFEPFAKPKLFGITEPF